MNNEDLQQLKAAHKLMRENPGSHAAFQEYKHLLFKHGDALIARIESLAADAERYRWLRDTHLGDDPESINLNPAKKRGLDQAIDAAIAKEKS